MYVGDTPATPAGTGRSSGTVMLQSTTPDPDQGQRVVACMAEVARLRQWALGPASRARGSRVIRVEAALRALEPSAISAVQELVTGGVPCAGPIPPAIALAGSVGVHGLARAAYGGPSSDS
eukprot:1709098-Alexandrium_andersonii.AAC.1